MKPAKMAFYFAAAAGMIFSIAMASTKVGRDLLPLVVALPGVAGLVSAILMVFRDAIAADRQAMMESTRNDLEIAFKSHAANTLFDKQAVFAEQYASRVNDLITELIGDGPSRKGASYYAELIEIRQKHAPWVTSTISDALAPFEKRLLDMSFEWEAYQLGGENRMAHYEKAEEIWSAFFGFERGTKRSKKLEHLGRAHVTEALQSALGISSLNLIRAAFLDKR